MSIGSFVKKLIPFASVALSATPIAPFLPVINAVLKKHDQPELESSDTGQDAIEFYNQLPTNVQQDLDNLELELEKQHTEQIKVLAEVDRTGNTTRPEIAKGAFQVIATTILITVAAIFIALWSEGLEHASNILQLGMGVAALLTPLVAIVYKYFGIRTSEKMMRYAVGTGHSPSTVKQPGILEGLIGGFRR